MVDLSIVIVSYNCREYLLGCLRSIFADTLDISTEVIVVDNVSTDGSLEAVQAQFPKVRIIANDTNVGMATGSNQGVEASTGRYVLYLNPDTEVSKQALEGVVQLADSRPDVALFSCRLLNGDGTLQHSCFRFPNLKMALYGFFPIVPMDSVENGRYTPQQYDKFFEPEHMLGAFLLVRRGTLDSIGSLDPKYFMYFEETDFCLRLKRTGNAALYSPEFSIVHHGGRSTSKVSEMMSVAFYRSQAYFYRKNYGAAKYVALKAIVFCGLAFWAARSSWACLRGRISAGLLRTRIAGYWAILLA